MIGARLFSGIGDGLATQEGWNWYSEVRFVRLFLEIKTKLCKGERV